MPFLVVIVVGLTGGSANGRTVLRAQLTGAELAVSRSLSLAVCGVWSVESAQLLQYARRVGTERIPTQYNALGNSAPDRHH
ncbi:hypothetical protein J6590_071776 [Homalodisca vitripennis]|nr:hypothetical protein J6590_071776 [Homalodisca vitripennis]